MPRISVRIRHLALLLSIGLVATFAVGPAPASAHHGGAHIVKLYSLTCWAQNDPSGDDEPYLKLNGNRFWENPDCFPVTTFNLGGMEISFWNQSILYIMEDDFGGDDTVGAVTVGPQAGQGVQTYFSYKSAPPGVPQPFNYQLVYEVL